MSSLVFVSQTLLIDSQFKTPNKGNNWSPFTMETWQKKTELLNCSKAGNIRGYLALPFSVFSLPCTLKESLFTA